MPEWSTIVHKAMSNLGEGLSAATSPKEAALAVLQTADQLFGWDAAFLDFLSPDDGRLYPVINIDTVNGVRGEVPLPRGGLRMSEISRRTIAEGPQIIIRSSNGPLEGSDLLPYGEAKRRSASLMFAAVRNAGTVVGILSLQSYTQNAYVSEDVHVLQALANYCAGALERTMSEKKLRESEERLRLVARATNDAVYEWDIITNEVIWNENVQSLFRYKPDEVEPTLAWWAERLHPEESVGILARLDEAVKSGEQAWVCEYRFRRGDDSYAFVLERGYIQHDDDGVAYRMIGSLMDMSERKAAEAQLLHGAYHDALTGLPNRAFFIDTLSRSIAHSGRREGYLFAVLFLDLDRFKIINDSLGHYVGDQLLIEVARRLELCLRPGDMVARLGGDEFTILLDDIHDLGDATRVAERVLHTLSSPVNIGAHEIFTSASIGVALSSTGYEEPENVLRDADIAMYRAKALGKARYELFDRVMHARATAQLQLESGLRRALRRGEFAVNFQPIISFESGKIAGFEALLRWHHPERGMVPPSEFIPMAEETGLIIPIGEWVLKEACEWLRGIHDTWNGERPPWISVNISARQLNQPAILSDITRVLNESGLDHNFLKLEITEGALVENAEATTNALHGLRALDVELVIDDFGTGYSSLSYLQRFPIDTLKIDRSFVTYLGTPRDNSQIVQAIIALACSMRMEVIAEGVENEYQLTQLSNLGCALGQGFLFSQPVSGSTAAAFAGSVMAFPSVPAPEE